MTFTHHLGRIIITSGLNVCFNQWVAHPPIHEGKNHHNQWFKLYLNQCVAPPYFPSRRLGQVSGQSRGPVALGHPGSPRERGGQGQGQLPRPRQGGFEPRSQISNPLLEADQSPRHVFFVGKGRPGKPHGQKTFTYGFPGCLLIFCLFFFLGGAKRDAGNSK